MDIDNVMTECGYENMREWRKSDHDGERSL